MRNSVARAIGVPPRRINDIVLGKRSITVDGLMLTWRLSRRIGGPHGWDVPDEVRCIVRCACAPLSYLNTMLDRIADHSVNRVAELLPWKILINALRPAAYRTGRLCQTRSVAFRTLDGRGETVAVVEVA
jgi:hypothetical protein